MGQICDAIRQEGIKIGESRGLAQGIEIGEVKGIEIGEANGIKKGEDNIIVSMLKKGFSIDVISDATEKSKEYILSIKNKLK